MGYNRGESGDNVWEKVKTRTMPSRRIKSQLDEMLASAFKIKDQNGNELIGMRYKSRPLNLMLIRITRGLLTYFYPNIEHSSLEWHIIAVHQQLNQDAFATGAPSKLLYDSRGTKEEFRFWRGIATDHVNAGIWMYLFHDSIFYIVTHQPRVKGIGHRLTAQH
jgi:hypothetical protein